MVKEEREEREERKEREKINANTVKEIA